MNPPEVVMEQLYCYSVVQASDPTYIHSLCTAKMLHALSVGWRDGRLWRLGAMLHRGGALILHYEIRDA